MLCKKEKFKKVTAFVFLLVFGIETFCPAITFALTSGPTQPEMQKFAEAGANDMVDLFTGDFKNNIPLLDVGGYPINISYQSGTGIEDEASWVGTGWSLNPGVVNRTMRGLPDDFNGDKVEKHIETKNFQKIGGSLSFKTTIFAIEAGKASVNLNIYKDNYWGIGASVGASLSASLEKNSATGLTAGLGLGLNSDVREGLSITPNASISTQLFENKENMSGGLSGSLAYNTRSGLKNFSLSASFSTPNKVNDESHSISTSKIHYFGQSYTPTIQYDNISTGKTFSFDIGPTSGVYVGGGGKGYIYNSKIKNNNISAAAYGYLNYLNGRNNIDALLDFNREKDGVFVTSAPTIPIPVATPDFFASTSQMGSQQFRPYFSGDYVVFDKAYYNKTDDLGIGVTVGIGNVFQAGARVEVTKQSTYSKKWAQEGGNKFLDKAEATDKINPNINPLAEPVYFKQVGEHTRSDQAFHNSFGNEVTQSVDLNSINTLYPRYLSEHGSFLAKNIVKSNREIRNQGFSFLTAAQASKYALETSINGNPRVDNIRKSHHMSEVTVTGNDGKRMVYGIPVYNLKQKEVSFAIDHKSIRDLPTARKTGIVNYTQGSDGYPAHLFGRDHYLSAETLPGYATSFLLTGVLSPDYVDVTHNGISDDDLGTAIKFDYKKLSNTFKWRAPFGFMQANFNEGSLSDTKDDKASYVYGEKEIWYMDKVQSKTMVALFYTSNREDGLGVIGETGGVNANNKQQRLDSIQLYSKADLVAQGSKAIPVKVVHFEYDYSLYPGVPNNSGIAVPSPLNPMLDLNATKGKLTLKKIYFTFGKNARGQSNPYEFFYDLRQVSDLNLNAIPVNSNPLDPEKKEIYTTQQQDRWGIYKPTFYNYLFNESATLLNNPEFPYTLQNNDKYGVEVKKLNNFFVSKWQLNKIITPTGSIIEIEYESDDYAYVQDRHAMQMCQLIGVQPSPKGFADAIKLKVKLPLPVRNNQELRTKYMEGIDNLFYKVMLDLDNTGHQEYVYGYASINLADCTLDPTDNLRKTALIGITPINGYNPIAKSAWQKLRVEFPQFAYDNYDNSETTSDFVAAIKSVLSAIGNLRELVQPFDTKAIKHGFASKVDYTKSMVRLNNPDGHKTGGGARVCKLTISDDWNNMTELKGSKNASFGQRYDYTIKNNDGSVISSGVASYEPQVGNEENPFHEPVNFTEKVHLAQDKYHFVEKPFCETYFPAAQVGYSKVAVYNIGDDYVSAGNTNPTGYTENEFYTARDFPVLVDNTSLQVNHTGADPILSLFASVTKENLFTSQGFKVEINDMHGKPKSVKTYNKGGDMLASTEYFYSTDNQNEVRKTLNNHVDILEPNGSISAGVTVATDIDIVTDVRNHHNENIGVSIGGYVGWLQAFILPILYGAVQVNPSYQSDTYKSSSFVKVIHKYGILKKIRTTQNGSTTEAENLLWDGISGEVLLTKNQNSFNDYTYNFHYPAYMVKEYEGMGPAYQNLGGIFNLSFDASNTINSTGSGYLFPGDELINMDVSVPQRGWIINASGSDDFPVLKLIDEKGELITKTGTYQIIRSGRGNLLNASVGSVVCLKDPRVNNQLVLSVEQKVLDAQSITYNDSWAVPVNNVSGVLRECRPGYQKSADGLSCYRDTKATFSGSNFTVCKVSQYGAYSSCGSMIYADYNVNGTAFNRSLIPISNPFWIGLPSDYNYFCNYAPAATRGPSTDSRLQTQKMISTSITSIDTFNIGNNFGKKTKTLANAAILGYYGPLNRCGIWVCSTEVLNPPDKWIGFTKEVIAPESKIYYIGMAADNNYRFKIDGVLKVQSPYKDPESFKVWHIYPVYLTKGAHIIEMEAQDLGSSATMGAEIYNNTSSEIQAASSYDMLNLIFSTKNLVGQNSKTGVYTCPDGYTLNTSVTPFGCREIIPSTETPACLDPTGYLINPYFKGVKGNWRPQTNYVYTVNREQKQGNSIQIGGTDIRHSGSYATFTPFWSFGNKGFIKNQSSDLSGRWVWSNTSVYYDQQGNEIEKVDALNRYGSALFGYRQSLAIAVAANARHNEIMYDGFEDYGFALENTPTQTCPLPKHFDWRISKQGAWYQDNLGNRLDPTIAHTGKYSFKLTKATSIIKSIGSSQHATIPLLRNDALGRYVLNSNELAKGFAPVLGKKQLLCMWVYDGNSSSNKIQNLVIKINGTVYDIANTVVPVVEGWKRLELAFLPKNELLNTFTLSLEPSGTVHIDDIRIMPFDADVKTFVYNEFNMRLVGQLDENNFATFYEYDDEGTLIRVKKETDRGIMTLKETRKAYRKRN